jgi:hypothetical protein
MVELPITKEAILQANKEMTMKTKVKVEIPTTASKWSSSVEEAIGERGMLLYEGTLGLEENAIQEEERDPATLPLRVAVVAEVKPHGRQLRQDQEMMAEMAANVLDAESMATFMPTALTLETRWLAMFEPSWLNCLIDTEMDKIHQLTQSLGRQRIQQESTSSEEEADQLVAEAAEQMTQEPIQGSSGFHPKDFSKTSSETATRLKGTVKKTAEMFQQHQTPSSQFTRSTKHQEYPTFPTVEEVETMEENLLSSRGKKKSSGGKKRR